MKERIRKTISLTTKSPFLGIVDGGLYTTAYMNVIIIIIRIQECAKDIAIASVSETLDCNDW